jgi:hypothetical protein
MIHFVENLFDDLQIQSFNNIIDNFTIPIINEKYISSDKNNGTGVCEELGRLQISDIQPYVPESIQKQISDLVKSFTDAPISLKHIMYVEYNCKYGEPNLPAHFDRDDGDLIINYQLDSNTSWEIGVGLKKYDLKDNSAIAFNGNTNIHWRTHKYFKDEEYVKMIFFRFHNPLNPSNYSHNPENQNDEAFQEVIKIRGRF